MAFLFEQDRGLLGQNKDPYPHLGPGVYDIKQDKKQRHGYAPFLSTDKRAKKNQLLQPGPGQYEISKPMGDSGIQAYMNKSTIIVKVQGNGSSAFKSGIPRFKEQQPQAPGPGHYDKEIPKHYHTQQKNTNDYLEDIRNINNQRKINSIPDQRIVQDARYEDIESLAQHYEELKKQQQYRKIGPTTYNVQLPKNDKGLIWAMDKQPRFQQQKQNDVGPYDITKDTQARYKKNASPAFVSSSVRSYFDQLVYHTNSEMQAELRKQQKQIPSKTPGPWSYEDNRKAIMVKSKPREYQFFGSSLERFKQIQSDSVGPAAYQINNSFDALNKKKNFVNATFMSTSGKDDHKDQVDMPGPGSYDLDEIQSMQRQVIKKFSLGYKGSFGQRGRRFDDVKQVGSAGPGSYEASKAVSTKAVSSSFTSKTKRQPYNLKDAPPIGVYNLNQNDISTRVQKQAKFLKNLERIDVQRPGFDSAQPRFQESKPDTTQENILITENARERSYTVDAPTNKETAPFKSQAPRISYQTNKATPGVGQYQVKNEWKVNSFNTHYNKLLEDD